MPWTPARIKNQATGEPRWLEAATGLLQVGECPADPQLDPAEIAAWAMVVSAILNTDEAVTKG